MGRYVKNPQIDGAAQSVRIPAGTTANQPVNPKEGMIRYNTTLNMLEFYNGVTFVQLQGGSGGASTITRDAFTMDGSTLSYGPLTFEPKAEQNVFVFIEGVFQKDDTYSISGTTITLSSTDSFDGGKTLSVIHGIDRV